MIPCKKCQASKSGEMRHTVANHGYGSTEGVIEVVLPTFIFTVIGRILYVHRQRFDRKDAC